MSIIFTLKNQVGNLARALQVFQELGINVLHLELSPLEATENQVRFISNGSGSMSFSLKNGSLRRTFLWTLNVIPGVWSKCCKC